MFYQIVNKKGKLSQREHLNAIIWIEQTNLKH